MPAYCSSPFGRSWYQYLNRNTHKTTLNDVPVFAGFSSPSQAFHREIERDDNDWMIDALERWNDRRVTER